MKEKGYCRLIHVQQISFASSIVLAKYTEEYENRQNHAVQSKMNIESQQGFSLIYAKLGDIPAHLLHAHLNY